MNPDVSVCINFHSEGVLALQTLRCLNNLREFSSNHGVNLEVLALLDSPTEETKRIVSGYGNNLFTSIELVEGFGAANGRNFLISQATSEYLAILDGDDLWSPNWIVEALSLASRHQSEKETIWHPEYVYYFYEEDFEFHSATETPHHLSNSHFVRHRDSRESQPKTALLTNHFSAHSFGARNLYLNYPYRENDLEAGLGIEDWSMNIETLANSVSHAIVPRTLHAIRVKKSSGENFKNFSSGLLPHLPPNFRLI
jgi:glycosyltransferase involved in cell wall biosynthesis